MRVLSNKVRRMAIIFGILIIITAYLQRREFGIGPEWVLPVIAAAIVPLKKGGKRNS